MGLADFGTPSDCTWANVNTDTKGRTTCTSNATPVLSLTASNQLVLGGTATAPVLSLPTDVNFTNVYGTSLFQSGAQVLSALTAGSGITVNGTGPNRTITNAGLIGVAGTANQITSLTTTGTATLSLPSAVVFPGTFTNSDFDMNWKAVGSGNIKIGSFSAEFLNALSIGHISIGRSAGNKVQRGTLNTIVGHQAAFTNFCSLTGVTAIGAQAAGNINATTETDGTYIGYLAGRADFGSPNFVAIGYAAGYSSTFCNGCMFVGDRSGYFHTQRLGPPYGSSTDEPNTYLGNSCGTNYVSGQGNVAIGFQAYFGPQTGSPTGSANTAVGTLSMQNGVGSLNTAIGRAALYGAPVAGVVTTTDTVAVGESALYNYTTSQESTAVGARAMFLVSNAVNSTCVGKSCMSTGASLLRATCFGAYCNGATDSVAFGFSAAASSTCLAIGNRASCSTPNTGNWGSSEFPYSLNTFSYACIGCNGTAPANTNPGDHSATRIFQANVQVLDTLVAGTGIIITGSGSSRTISTSALVELEVLKIRLESLERLLMEMLDYDR